MQTLRNCKVPRPGALGPSTDDSCSHAGMHGTQHDRYAFFSVRRLRGFRQVVPKVVTCRKLIVRIMQCRRLGRPQERADWTFTQSIWLSKCSKAHRKRKQNKEHNHKNNTKKQKQHQTNTTRNKPNKNTTLESKLLAN